MIQRDLARTYPRLRLFKETSGEGQRAMGRILRAYSVLDSEVGYCQGLGFLVGPLLMNVIFFLLLGGVVTNEGEGGLDE